jgi:hypothetical protein
METETKRILLFLFGCIGLRSYIVYLSSKKEYLSYMTVPAFLIGFGFLYIYFTNSRQTGPEVFGDKIWWNDLRPLHGLLWISFAILAALKNENAWKLLLADVLIGLISFINFHHLISS